MAKKYAPKGPSKQVNNNQGQGQSQGKQRGLGTWLLYNAGLLLVAYVMISKVPAANDGYQWLWEGYVKQNLEMIKQYPDATYDQKLMMKLGADYQYLVYVRDNTPQNAVIYLPTKGDFVTVPAGQEKSQFSGNMADKLSAVRVLYPRRVVTTDELGKTSWAKRMTHICIVNGCNRQMLRYPVDSTYAIGVLPINPPKQK